MQTVQQVEPGDSVRPNRAERRAEASDKRRARKRRLRPRFISINQACDYLNCSRSFFYAALYSKVKTVKLGKRTLVDLDSLDEVGDSLPAAG